MYWVKTPYIFIKILFSKLTWKLNNNDNSIYLTFDDGPSPGVTDKLLDVLNEKDVKASFFCLGENIDANPRLFDRIKREGHLVANHGYKHLNAWRTSSKLYYKNISKAQNHFDNTLYRPPYGKLKLGSIRSITTNNKIVMWDIMSGDFDKNITIEKCINNVLSNVVSGSIIVFHDNYKSKDTMLQSIPIIIDKLIDKGFNFQTISLPSPKPLIIKIDSFSTTKH